MTESPVATLLANSFEVLEAELPEAYARMGTLLEGATAAIEIDAESFAVHFPLRRPRVRPPTGDELVHVATARSTLLELLDGQRSLTSAILSDTLRVIGPLDSLLRFQEGLRLYLHGAARCSGFAPLLRRLRHLDSSIAEVTSPPSPGAHVDSEKEQPPPEKDQPPPEQGQKKDEAMPKVYIFGGGISGLTAAHELVIRGFDVTVYERASLPGATTLLEKPTLGGMARTQYFAIQKKHSLEYFQRRQSGQEDQEEEFQFDPFREGFDKLHMDYLLRSESRAAASYGSRSSGLYPDFWFEFTENMNDTLVLTKTSKSLLYNAITTLAGIWRKTKGGEKQLQAVRGVTILVQGFVDPSEIRENSPGVNGAPLNNQTTRVLGPASKMKRILRCLLKGVSDDLANTVKGPGDDKDIENEPFAAYSDYGLPPIARNWVRVIVYAPILPGEHGYRFFPSFYRHVFDTMRRIPLYEATGQPSKGTVYDNLIGLPRIAILSERTAPFVARWEPLRAADTFALVNRGLRNLRELELSTEDVIWFSLRILRYMTTCPRRRAAELEGLSWWNYLEGYDPGTGRSLYRYSDYFKRLVTSSSRVMVALDGKRGDARTCGNTFVQLLTEALVATPQNNSTLNGPTTESWFYHWRKYLEDLGVDIFQGTLTTLKLESQGIVAYVNVPNLSDDGITPTVRRDKIPDSNNPAEKIYFVVATDLLGAKDVTKDLVPMDGVPEKLPGYVNKAPSRPGDAGSIVRDPEKDAGRSDWDRLQMISGIQFFFKEHVRLCEGYVYCVDSEWSISAIASQNVWQNPPSNRLSQYQSIISVDVGDWRQPARRLDGKTAWECTPKQLAKEVLDQLRDSLKTGASGQPTNDFNIPEPAYVHIDDGLVFKTEESGELDHNETPYLVPTAGDWKNRPGPEPWNPAPQAPPPPDSSKPTSPNVWQAPHGGYWIHWDRLVFAGTYLRTYTRMTTMESANESARHAVNAILDHWMMKHGKQGQGPAIPQQPVSGHSNVDEDLFPTTPSGDYCRIWDPERNELPDFMLLQRLDDENFDRGLPHPWDQLGLERLPSLLSQLPGAGDPFARIFELMTRFSPWATPRASHGLLSVLRRIREVLESARPQAHHPPHPPQRD